MLGDFFLYSEPWLRMLVTMEDYLPMAMKLAVFLLTELNSLALTLEHWAVLEGTSGSVKVILICSSSCLLMSRDRGW